MKRLKLLFLGFVTSVTVLRSRGATLKAWQESSATAQVCGVKRCPACPDSSSVINGWHTTGADGFSHAAGQGNDRDTYGHRVSMFFLIEFCLSGIAVAVAPIEQPVEAVTYAIHLLRPGGKF